MAELLGRKPLFPGKDYVQQLNLITKVSWQLSSTLVLLLVCMHMMYSCELCQVTAAPWSVKCAAESKQQQLLQPCFHSRLLSIVP